MGVRRYNRFIMPLRLEIIAMCSKCGECFTWLPDSFDMRHRFNRETHQFCGGLIARQEPEIVRALRRIYARAQSEDARKKGE
jgi:hypothetical protein